MLTIILIVVGLFIIAVMGERLYTLERELTKQRNLNKSHRQRIFRSSL